MIPRPGLFVGAAPLAVLFALALVMIALTTATLWSLGQNLVFVDASSA